MSNAMMIARTHKQENGWDSYNDDWYSWKPVSVTVKVRGKVITWKPEGGMKNVRTA